LSDFPEFVVLIYEAKLVVIESLGFDVVKPKFVLFSLLMLLSVSMPSTRNRISTQLSSRQLGVSNGVSNEVSK